MASGERQPPIIKGHYVNASMRPGQHQVTAYNGPYDDDGVPLTAYCQEIKAFVRSNPEMFRDARKYTRTHPVCKECGRAVEHARAWYCPTCKQTIVQERRREVRRQCDRRRRHGIREIKRAEQAARAEQAGQARQELPSTRDLRARGQDRDRHAAGPRKA